MMAPPTIAANLTDRPAAQLEEEFIPLPRARPLSAPILPDTPLVYREPGYFPQLDVTDRLVLSLGAFLPPAEYDRPYQGRLRIIYLDTPETVVRMCTLAARGVANVRDKAIGCAVRGNLKRLDADADCVIFILESISHLRYGRTFNGMMRHEIGHCNGWDTHEGMRDASAEPSLIPTKSKKPWVPLSQ
jgi:hypothetical protein